MNLLFATSAGNGRSKDKRPLGFVIKCAILAVGLAGCGGGSSSNSSSNVDNQRSVVFQSNRDGDFEILRMNENGTGVTRITNNGVNDDEPSISSDGKSIVFASDRTGNKEIYIVNNTGTEQITKNNFRDENPEISPDGKQVVFISTRQGMTDLFSIDLQSKKESRLTSTEFVESSAEFLPNGNIIFTNNISGEFVQIYEMNANGQQLRQITNDETNHLFPTVSADNKTIVFASDFEGTLNIYSLERASGAIKALTRGSGSNTEPTFSRDGRRIFFSSNRTGNNDIFSMNLDGSDVRNLTNDPSSDRAPSVQ